MIKSETVKALMAALDKGPYKERVVRARSITGTSFLMLAMEMVTQNLRLPNNPDQSRIPPSQNEMKTQSLASSPSMAHIAWTPPGTYSYQSEPRRVPQHGSAIQERTSSADRFPHSAARASKLSLVSVIPPPSKGSGISQIPYQPPRLAGFKRPHYPASAFSSLTASRISHTKPRPRATAIDRRHTASTRKSDGCPTPARTGILPDQRASLRKASRFRRATELFGSIVSAWR